MAEKLLRVSVVARLAGVTVRTLHHYDAIGLLSPSRRSSKGYRLYAGDDLLRLQQILIRRALGMPLEQIRRALDDPDFDLGAALREQRAQLVARREATTEMIRSIDAALTAIDPPEDTTMTEHRDLFDGFDPGQYEDEARERWGETPAWAESKRRTARYGPEDWVAIKSEVETIELALAEQLRAGTPATDPAARALAERHRLHIDRWFYPCASATHLALGRMYVDDPRFAAHYERRAEGLAAYLCEAIAANAAQPEAPD